jgi:hypothetical protein
MAKRKTEVEEEDGISHEDIFCDSTQVDIDESHFLVHAPQGVGKTFTGISSSKKWPAGPLKKSKKIIHVIDDVAHIGADKGSVDGLRQYGIRVVHHIDMRRLLRPPKKGEKKRPVAEDMMQALDWATDAVEARVYKHGLTSVVFDTLTNLSNEIVKVAEALDFRTKSGEPNNYAKWDYVSDALHTLWTWGCNLPCQVYWLCHSEGMREGETRKEQLNVKAMKGIGQWDIIPKVDGRKGFGLFTSHTSMIATMEAEYDEETKTWNRWILPLGGNGFLGKNRWLDCLDEREPPNMNAIIKKIKKSGGSL